ncbi:DNA-J related domain-containing protein [Thalassotalea sp. 1_MG-2023]|uniref:DNA-J related domain-containing protein n=1 Tax=Thalassotalea sp. 1_MG-2023 TaxID=3062680 RepID=UPI0026E3C70B|nr:DNA-J related domain-containing protein [Thalassotalea sp. 1_MG-2023]MDO6426057.1 DNA-J related domain-containing protein [Thalassotalea sp. 1_MG-2023]
MRTLNPYLTPIFHELEHYFSVSPASNEYDIIKHLANEGIAPFNNFSLADHKDLFSAHFLCMHALYHLKAHYKTTQEYQLFIESVRIKRVAINNAILDEHSSKNTLETTDPLASYYLNPQHYFETQEHEISDMIKSFWQKYLAHDAKEEALETLCLPIDADKKMVKAQYLKLANKYHPDKGGCADTFSKIRHAKAVLDKLF